MAPIGTNRQPQSGAMAGGLRADGTEQMVQYANFGAESTHFKLMESRRSCHARSGPAQCGADFRKEEWETMTQEEPVSKGDDYLSANRITRDSYRINKGWR